MCLCAYMSLYMDRDAIAGQYIITIIILNRKFTQFCKHFLLSVVKQGVIALTYFVQTPFSIPL